MGLRSAGERLGRAPNTTRERGDLAKEQGGVSGQKYWKWGILVNKLGILARSWGHCRDKQGSPEVESLKKSSEEPDLEFGRGENQGRMKNKTKKPQNSILP